MHGDELCSVGKNAFDLKDRQHRCDAGHHVAGGQDRRSERHQVGDASSLARALEDFIGDDRDGFGMVELEPFGAALSRQLRGGEDGEAFKLGRRQQHARSPLTRKQTQMRAGMARGGGVDPGHETLDLGAGATGADRSAIVAKTAASTVCASTAPMRPSRTAAAISPAAVE